MRSKTLWPIVTIVFAILAMAAAAVMLTTGRGPSRVSRTASPSPTSAPAPALARTPAPAAKPTSTRIYTVGIIISHASANAIWTGNQKFGYSYEHAVRELRDPHVKLVPLLEPGTASDPEIANALAGTFKNALPPLDVTDATALKTLDVIVVSRALVALPESLSAVESAVRDGGVGLLAWGSLGDQKPGFDDDRVGRLTGFTDAQWGYTPDPPGVECTVLAAHPILGKLKPGAKLKLQASGAYGVLPPPPDGIALVTVADQSQVRVYNTTATRPSRTDLQFHPIYLSRLGKGKIVGCSFPAFRQLPPSLNRAVGGDFLLRSVAWVARGEETR